VGISVQFRRGTAANWTSANTILLAGEVGFETDTLKFKIGDGVTAWTSLAYVSDLTTAVLKSLYDPNTILAATADNTPAALTVGEQTVVGRITGGAIAALTVAQLLALVFSSAMTENVEIQLTAAPSADGKYSGITEAGTLGETVAYGECVYFKTSDSKWYLAKADAAATSTGKIAICLVGGAANASTRVLLFGKIRADAKFPTFTIGTAVFISAATGGQLVSTAPSGSGNEIRIVGSGNTAHELYFNPSPDWLEHA